MIQKVKNKLNKWRGKYLTFTRKLTLVKSVVTTLSLFFVAIFKMETHVSEEIKRHKREFLWD